MPVVIVSETDGIFVGHALGLGFWSLLDSVGQQEVCTFENTFQARQFVRKWGNPDAYTYRQVKTKGDFATVKELKAAGLGKYLGDIEDNALKYVDCAGSA